MAYEPNPNMRKNVSRISNRISNSKSLFVALILLPSDTLRSHVFYAGRLNGQLRFSCTVDITCSARVYLDFIF